MTSESPKTMIKRRKKVNLALTKTRVNNLLVNIDTDYEFMRQMSKKLLALKLTLMILSEFMSQ